MGRILADVAIEQYRRRGYLSPVHALTTEEAAAYLRQLESFERRQGSPLAGSQRHKSHLLFAWLDKLVRHPHILDIVEDVIGPDILVWNSNFFIKEANDPAFVSWHQDSTYWGLDPPEAVTAWVALTASNAASGCVRFIPASHRKQQLPHRERAHEHNLLSRGQEIAVKVDESEAVCAILEPGEISLHDVRLVHGSQANRSPSRRIGIAIRYISTRVRQTAGPDSAMLVRGRDDYHHFEPEMMPAGDMDPAAIAHHAAVMQRHAELVMAGANKKVLK